LKLLRLYAGLIVSLKRDLVRLHEACISGKLKELITAEYEKRSEKCVNYDWFKENPDVVKNQYPLPLPESGDSASAPSEPVASTSSAGPSTLATSSVSEAKVEPAAEVKAEKTEPMPEAVKSESTA
jgi:hypothetical protein